MRYLSLAVVLVSLWLLLSGHTEVIILGLGGASVALVMWLSHRMKLVDEEGVPVDSLPRALPYSLWLLVEIVKSNFAMLPVLLSKDPKVQPQIVEVSAGESGSLGQVTYANSITMTPGTVTLSVRDDVVTVHALTDATAEGLKQGDMGRRAMRVGGAKRRGGTS